MNKKKILITGGTGFIGKEVLKLLSRNNFKILCISRRTQRKKGNITWIKSNLNIQILNKLIFLFKVSILEKLLFGKSVLDQQLLLQEKIQFLDL